METVKQMDSALQRRSKVTRPGKKGEDGGKGGRLMWCGDMIWFDMIWYGSMWLNDVGMFVLMIWCDDDLPPNTPSLTTTSHPLPPLPFFHPLSLPLRCGRCSSIRRRWGHHDRLGQNLPTAVPRYIRPHTPPLPLSSSPSPPPSLKSEMDLYFWLFSHLPLPYFCYNYYCITDVKAFGMAVCATKLLPTTTSNNDDDNETLVSLGTILPSFAGLWTEVAPAEKLLSEK